ncbi:MAG TPA: thermostable hemolysin [Rhodocyclaceae bacterium]|nr:thermostable hemolysin [Rhodocyclaceae bacterium]
MSRPLRNTLQSVRQPLTVTHVLAGSPRRAGTEDFIRTCFSRHYGARIPSFAPNLTLLENAGGIVAATGWRCAGDEPLYLENYLDEPIENAVARLAGQPVPRESIAEAAHLASHRAGASLDVILTLARHLDRLGFEWVTFTATRTLVGIFARLGLPLLSLASANPARLGPQAAAWGSYYDTEPIVVAGRIRLAIEKAARHG